MIVWFNSLIAGSQNESYIPTKVGISKRYYRYLNFPYRKGLTARGIC